MTKIVKGLTDILVELLYPLPSLEITTLTICPRLLISTLNSASVPVPFILKLGGTLYPLPESTISTLVILPLVIIGLNTAGDILFVLTNCKSLKVSTVRSYSF